MIEGNTSGVPNNYEVTFGNFNKDKYGRTEFPQEKFGKKLIKSAKEIWQEAADSNIKITASDNTAEILQQLENSKIHKDAKGHGTDTELVH